MENDNAKSIIKRYRTQYFAVAGILPALYLIIAYSTEGILMMFAAAFALIFLMVKARNLLYTKHINSALNVDFDPVQYRANLTVGNLISGSALERIIAAYYNRDYQAVVDICTLKVNDRMCRRYRLHYLNFLARTYFEVGDIEKLRMVCGEAEAFCRSDKMKKELNKTDSTFRFFALYLDGEYEACRERMEKLLEEPKTREKKWNEIHARFYYAIACYRCGDLEAAKDNFNQVIHTAPKMNYAHIAQECLSAMENGTDYQPEYRELRPTENFTLTDWTKKKKQLRKVAIIAVCAWLVICGIGYGCKAVSNGRYHAAVAEKYDDFEIVKMFDVNYENAEVGRLCVCDTEEDGLVFGGLYRENGSEQYIFEPQQTNLQPGFEYVGYVAYQFGIPHTYKVYIRLFENEAEIPADKGYRITEIKADGKTYLFGMTDFQYEP